MLTSHHIEQYKADGAVVVPSVLDVATCKLMKDVFTELVEGSRKVTEHDNVYGLEANHSAENPRVRRIKKPLALRHGIHHTAL